MQRRLRAFFPPDSGGFQRNHERKFAMHRRPFLRDLHDLLLRLRALTTHNGPFESPFVIRVPSRFRVRHKILPAKAVRWKNEEFSHIHLASTSAWIPPLRGLRTNQKKVCGQSSTSPRPSPQGEGELSAAFLENHVPGIAGQSATEPETANCFSFSQGEKVRMRASREEYGPAPGN